MNYKLFFQKAKNLCLLRSTEIGEGDAKIIYRQIPKRLIFSRNINETHVILDIACLGIQSIVQGNLFTETETALIQPYVLKREEDGTRLCQGRGSAYSGIWSDKSKGASTHKLSFITAVSYVS